MRKLMRLFTLAAVSALLLPIIGINTAKAAPTTSFTWQSFRQRAAENNNRASTGTNNWVTNNGTLSFTQTGAQSYIEDFVETTQTFNVEGVRIEWDMQASVATSLGYVGPYVVLTQTSGTGWNSAGLGAQVWYRWETSGRSGAVLHAGRLGNRVISPDPTVPGVNDGAFAHHVVTVSKGVVTWTAGGKTMSTMDTGAAPYTPMRLMVGARLYDNGVVQTIQIRNLTVTTGGSQYTGPMNATVTGTISDAAGNKMPVIGSAHVDFRTTTAANGTTSATISGAMSVSDDTLGSVYVPFTGTYNETTNTFSGTYTDPLGGHAQNFQFANAHDTTWRGRITGTTATASGARNYDLTIEVTVPPEIYNSVVDLSALRYTGPISATQSISIPFNIPEIGINTTETLNVNITGNWNIGFAPGRPGSWNMSGQASGTFVGDRTISLTGHITQGTVSIPVPISIAIAGTFGGTLSGTTADNNVRFTGNWTTTSGDQTFGGNVDISLPVDRSSGGATKMTAAFTGAVGSQIAGTARAIAVGFSANSNITSTRP